MNQVSGAHMGHVTVRRKKIASTVANIAGKPRNHTSWRSVAAASMMDVVNLPLINRYAEQFVELNGPRGTSLRSSSAKGRFLLNLPRFELSPCPSIASVLR